MTGDDARLLGVFAAESAALTACGAHVYRGRRLRPRPQLPVALCLLFALVADLAGAALLRWVLLGPVHTYRGWTLVGYHAANLLSAAWPAAVAVLAAWTFCRTRRGRPNRRPFALIGAAFLVAAVYLVAFCPALKAPTSLALQVVELGAVLAAALCAWAGWPRDWGLAHAVCLWLAGVELVVALLGPFAVDPYATWSTVGRDIYIVSFGAVAVAYAVAWIVSLPARKS